MSRVTNLLSAAVIALPATFASAQEQVLTQNPSIDTAFHTREPIYVVLPTSDGELMRNFTACTSDNHYITGSYALRADIDYANAQIANGGFEALSRRTSVDGFIYQRALTEVIGSMTSADLKQSQIRSSHHHALMRQNVTTVHAHFTQAHDSPIEYNFHINYDLSRNPNPRACTRA